MRALNVRADVEQAWHLYVVEMDETIDRDRAFSAFRQEGVGVNVHYIPVHLHPYYRRRFDTGLGLCPRAEEAYAHILSLPIFPRMTDEDVETVIAAVRKVVSQLQGEE